MSQSQKGQEDNILEKIHSLKFWTVAHNGLKLNDPLKSILSANGIL